jgi:hypothetical protein
MRYQPVRKAVVPAFLGAPEQLLDRFRAVEIVQQAVAVAALARGDVASPPPTHARPDIGCQCKGQVAIAEAREAARGEERARENAGARTRQASDEHRLRGWEGCGRAAKHAAFGIEARLEHRPVPQGERLEQSLAGHDAAASPGVEERDGEQQQAYRHALLGGDQVERPHPVRQR